jgi:DNA-binding transcriptional MerR regulator
MAETPVYNLKDLSKKLNLSIRTLRKYIKRGDLKARKIGKAYYVTEPNLLDFLEA